MDLTCRFGLQYRPVRGESDPVAELHVRNCPDCQEQTVLVGSEA